MIINDASRIALRQKSKITMAILEDIISKTKPSLTVAELNKYLAIKSKMDGEVSSSNLRPRVGFNVWFELWIPMNYILKRCFVAVLVMGR